MDESVNILLIRLKSMGDVILTLPAVNLVRDHFPSAKITFFTLKQNAALLRGFRAVDEVIALDRAALRNPLSAPREMARLLARLRAGRFTLAVDFQGYGETAWLSWWSGAPERWGSVYGPGRLWLYTRGVPRNDRLLIADWNLSLLSQCGLGIPAIRNEFVLPADALEAARNFFAERQLNPSKRTLFIQPFTSSAQKNWPLENYLLLAACWREQGVQVVFGGGPGDIARLQAAGSAGYCVAAGNPLLVSAGLVKLSTVIIGGVTGLLHLAVAMRKRVIMLIGSRNEPGFPFQHRDWGITPNEGENVAGIQLPAVITECAKAFNEPADNVSC